VLAVGLAGSAVLAAVLLARTPDFAPWVGPVSVVVALTAAIAVAVPSLVRGWPRLAAAAIVAALVAVLLGPASFAVATVGTAYGGGDPAAGPQTGAFRAGGPGAIPGGPDGAGAGGAGTAPTGPGGPPGGPDGAGAGGAGTAPTGPGGPPGGRVPTPGGPGVFREGPGGIGPGQRAGGGLDPSALDYLIAKRGTADWLVAVASANQSAPIQLATGVAVMAMGGFTGSDPALTTEGLQALIHSGRLRFVLSGGFGPGFGPGGPGPIGGQGLREVNAWVAQHCASVGSVAAGLYDCRGAA
jgi:hypothetical protein